MMENIQEKLLFLHKFLRAPKQIGSITPSSMFLAKKILEQVNWNRVDHIAELGAGTGAITKYIDAVNLKDANVMLFEKEASLRDQLMDQIVTSLKPGGLFIAFQYSQQMKKQLSTLFDIEHVHYVPWNIPPAFVYVCRKRL